MSKKSTSDSGGQVKPGTLVNDTHTKPFGEGMIKKGGVNLPPTTQKPSFKPVGQGGGAKDKGNEK